MSKTITAFFDNFDDAANAVRRLEDAGFQHEDISLIANNREDRYTHHANGRVYGGGRDETYADEGAGTGATVGALAGGGTGLLAGLGMLAVPGLGPVVAAGWLVSTLVGSGAGAAVGGLVGALVGTGVDESDAHAYAEGVRRGGALVTVKASEAQVDRVVGVLEDAGSLDLGEREETWRNEGWMGRSEAIGAAASTTTGMTTGLMGESGARSAIGESGSMGTSGATRSATGSERSTMRDTDEEVIPVAEEELHVSKREVNRGRVRIHTHMVERPIEEQVTLREEHVEVERRPVERSLRAGDMSNDDLFRERTVEIEEHAEEPIVSKEARVREELVVKKGVQQRTETVSDKVRSTEVEVEDERGNRITGTDRDRK